MCTCIHCAIRREFGKQRERVNENHTTIGNSDDIVASRLFRLIHREECDSHTVTMLVGRLVEPTTDEGETEYEILYK